ncbi:hypothetical protein HOY80DRAFT_970213, partial [Tuber brumale]
MTSTVLQNASNNGFKNTQLTKGTNKRYDTWRARYATAVGVDYVWGGLLNTIPHKNFLSKILSEVHINIIHLAILEFFLIFFGLNGWIEVYLFFYHLLHVVVCVEGKRLILRDASREAGEENLIMSGLLHEGGEEYGWMNEGTKELLGGSLQVHLHGRCRGEEGGGSGDVFGML